MGEFRNQSRAQKGQQMKKMSLSRLRSELEADVDSSVMIQDKTFKALTKALSSPLAHSFEIL